MTLLPTGLRNHAGLGWALVILGGWAVGLWGDFALDLAQVPIPVVAVLVLVQTFLHTGLFITAHDAMHGSVCPTNPRLNDGIGRLAVWCYALLSYRQLKIKHILHHRAPATDEDPDFSRGNIWNWFFHFMGGYMRGRQGLIVSPGMTLIFVTLVWGLHVPLANVLIFWGLPLIFSPLQLFFFGTYLPHRVTKAGYPAGHNARSSGYPALLSFLTCYHFGYHWEHHEYPHLPWYRLPSAQPHP